MTKGQKRAVACAVFVPGIIGALVPSFLHLAAWFEAWMPEGWEHLSYVAALVTEAPIFACGVCAILMPPSLRVRWPLYALLGFSVAVSIYVNVRWGWSQLPDDGPVTWAMLLDVLAGSAVLPLFALFGELALDVVWRWVEDDPRKVSKPAALAERKQPRPEPQEATATSSLAAKWRAVIGRHGEGKTLTELAALEGVSRQAVGQWRKAAEGG